MESGEGRYSEAVIQAVDNGNKVKAIKQLRVETGVSLEQAKKEIDSLHHSRQPARGLDAVPEMTTEEGGAGGLLKLGAVIAVLVAAYVYYVYFA